MESIHLRPVPRWTRGRRRREPRPVHTGIQCAPKCCTRERRGGKQRWPRRVWELNRPRLTGSRAGRQDMQIHSWHGRGVRKVLGLWDRARRRLSQLPLRLGGYAGWVSAAMPRLQTLSALWHGCLPRRQQGLRCALAFFSDPEQRQACLGWPRGQHSPSPCSLRQLLPNSET